MAIHVKNNKNKRKLSVGIIAAVFVAGFGLFNIVNSNMAEAATRIWVGGGTTAVFSDPANWSGGNIPQDGDIIVLDEATIPIEEGASAFEVTNDIVGLELNGISFINNQSDWRSFDLIGNPLSIQGSIEADEIYVTNNGDPYGSTNTIKLNLTATGPLAIDGIALGDVVTDYTLNMGAHPLTLSTKDDIFCGATGIKSSIIGSGAILVSTTGEGNTTQITGNNDGFTGTVTIASGAALMIGESSTRNVSMLQSEGQLVLGNTNNADDNETIEITTPMRLAGEIRSISGDFMHIGGCGGYHAYVNYELTGGVELIGNLSYIGGEGMTPTGEQGQYDTVPTDTHITSPFRPHQYSITTDANSVGSITTDTPILDTAPAAPTGLSATPSPGQIALSWTAPSNNGGQAITDYVVQYKLAADSTWTTFNDGTSTATSATITGLPNGQLYDVRVSAVNSIGTGAAVTATNVSLIGVAGAPTGLTGTPTSGQVALSWTAPAYNGGTAITDYTVEYKLSSASTWTNVAHTASTATTRTVTGLANGSTYDFRVSTVNAQGQSSFATVTNLLVPAVVAGAPTGLSGTPSAGQVALTWTAPASNGGSAITDYTVEYKLSSASTWTNVAHTASTATTRTVTGLANGTSYDFRVATVNAAGTSAFTTAATISTPVIVPTAPLNLSGSPAVGQVLLDWDAPTSTGGATITDYTIEYKLSSASTWTAFAHTASSATTRAVTGLTNGAAYDFRVRAVNSAGTGPQVAITNITVQASTASAPQNLVVTPSSEQVVLNWATPATNGGATITDYTIQYKLASDGAWTTFTHTASTSTTATITGLTNDSAYDFRVSAVNGEGQGSFITVTGVEVSAGTTAPSTPSSFEASLNSSDQLVLEWTAPGNNGGLPITGYEIGYKPSSSSTWQYISVPASAGTDYTFVSGLTDGVTYDFSLVAVNAEGNGPATTITNFEYEVSIGDGGGSTDPAVPGGNEGAAPEAPGAPNTGALKAKSGNAFTTVLILAIAAIATWIAVRVIRKRLAHATNS